MAPDIHGDLVPFLTGTDHQHEKSSYPEPLKLSGALERFSYEDATPVIGREFFNVNIVDDLLNSDDSDELLRDLAITSEYPIALYHIHTNIGAQFRSAASSSSARRTISRMTSKSVSSTDLDNLVASPPLQRCTSIRY